MDLKIEMWVDPEVPLTNCRENRCPLDGARVEVVEFDPVVVRERSHESAQWHPEPTLVERHETDDIALRRIRLLLIPVHDPFGGTRGGGTAKQTSIDKIVQILHGHGRVGHRSRGTRTITLSAIVEMRM